MYGDKTVELSCSDFFLLAPALYDNALGFFALKVNKFIEL